MGAVEGFWRRKPPVFGAFCVETPGEAWCGKTVFDEAGAIWTCTRVLGHEKTEGGKKHQAYGEELNEDRHRILYAQWEDD